MPINAQDGPDTEFYGDSATGTLSELATDDSGHGDDLTVDAGVITTGAASARADLPGQRTIDVDLNFADTDTGTVYQYGNNALEIDTGDVICVVNSSAVITHTITSLTTAQDVLISWATEANPLTTGASDAYRSDLWVYDGTDWDHTTATHAIEASTGQDMVWLGSDPGTDLFTGTANALRISSAYHSSTETSETFVLQSSAPTLAGAERIEFSVPSMSAGSGDDGMHVGPIEAVCAAAVRANDLLMAGPIVNEVCTGAFAEDSTWIIDDPDAAAFGMHLEFIRRRPIPPAANRVRARVFVQQNAPSAEDLIIRVYSANAPGPTSSPGSSPDDYIVFSASVTRNADDGTGTGGGAWVDLGNIRISRDNEGYSYFWIGFTPGSVTDYRVRAWTIEPVQDNDGDVAGGGGGFG